MLTSDPHWGSQRSPGPDHSSSCSSSGLVPAAHVCWDSVTPWPSGGCCWASAQPTCQSVCLNHTVRKRSWTFSLCIYFQLFSISWCFCFRGGAERLSGFPASWLLWLQRLSLLTFHFSFPDMLENPDLWPPSPLCLLSLSLLMFQPSASLSLTLPPASYICNHIGFYCNTLDTE